MTILVWCVWFNYMSWHNNYTIIIIIIIIIKKHWAKLRIVQ